MLTKENENKLVAKMKKQGRLAYDVVKTLKRETNKKVSYTIEHQVLIDDNNIRILTSIKEFPIVRVGHALADNENEYLTYVDIDNIDD